MKKCYVISEFHGNDFHAGPKAPRDIEKVLDSCGVHCFKIRRPRFQGVLGGWLNRMIWLLLIRLYRQLLPRDATVLMQYPSAAWSKSAMLRLLNLSVKKRKMQEIIVVVHDVASLRSAGANMRACNLWKEEQDLFNLADKIVVHNRCMLIELEKRGIAKDKMICLNCFDYLTTNNILYQDRKLSNTIVIAGNLATSKCGYLAKLSSINGIQWYLYGVNFDASRLFGENITYNGCFPPEELPQKIEGAFGLVWDGDSIETCLGPFGEYTRINNPHKLSLYLASGLPVIVWREAAIADFVKKHNCGILVESLFELPKKLNSLSTEEYEIIQKNAITIGKKISTGFFTKQIISMIESVF